MADRPCWYRNVLHIDFCMEEKRRTMIAITNGQILTITQGTLDSGTVLAIIHDDHSGE